jgi:phosphoglucosamine mutase
VSTPPRFGTDGVRGVANDVLTPTVAMALGRAAVEEFGASQLIIGADTRLSSDLLVCAMAAGVASAGANAVLLGVVPTPAVALAAQNASAPAAMVSASHNPFTDNGIKLFAPGGLKLDDVTQSRIEAKFHRYLAEGMGAGPLAEHVGSISPDDSGAVDAWVKVAVGSIEGRSLNGLKIVLDCAHGSAYELGPRVFGELDAEIVVLGDSPNGVNINEGVGSTHPQALRAAVVAEEADFGLAFDGDADRLIAVDNDGNLVDGDHILAMLAADWSARGILNHNTVVVTVMTNLGFYRAMAAAGIEVVQTPVGDRSVLVALDDGDYSLGGEQSGHVICRNLATTGDGVLTAVQLADTINRSRRSLSDLASEAMTSVPQILRNVIMPTQIPDVVERMFTEINQAEAEMGDAGRVLVRPSGTEPLVRVMVEHLDPGEADRICGKLVAAAEALVAS